jgi:glycosyltransferase involved in cell wall biosynthesis
VVLSNDVAEGPDFRRLAARGFRIYTIYHVDVVDYVASIYLRSRVRPETLVRWQERMGNWWMPDIARLIFEKQRDSLACSRAVIVPSEAMREVLLRCYPREASGKVQVIPWGVWDSGTPASPEPLRREFGMPDDALCLLALSRISPEKGQDLLLEALIEWERRGDLPERPLWLFICGEAAYMQGRRFLDRLHRLAARLRRVRVIFPGYVTGQRKQALFALADVYVFPSRHESYGLTLLEALQAGLPSVCLDNHGAREVMRPEFGEIVPAIVPALRDALARILSNEEGRRRQSTAARGYAAEQRFADSAAALADLLATAPSPAG